MSTKTKLSVAHAGQDWSNGEEHCAAPYLIVGLNLANVCGYICKYGSQNGSLAMVITKRPLSVTSEINRLNPLPAGDKECK